MSDENRVGEVEQTTATTTVTVEDILANKDMMAEILKSTAVQELVQSEADKVRTKASKEKESASTEFARYKMETDKRIAELTKFQQDYFKTETLKKSGLDIELWQYVSGETEEEILKSAKDLTEKISKLAEKKVGGNPSTTTKMSGITQEQFGKMTYAEKAELFQNNQALYQKLAKGE